VANTGTAIIFFPKRILIDLAGSTEIIKRNKNFGDTPEATQVFCAATITDYVH
jgi:hypothetical protein